MMSTRLSSAPRKGAATRPNLVRIAFVVVLAVVGAWFAFALAVSGITRHRNPDVALRFVPIEANALANKANFELANQDARPNAAIAKTAEQALRQQALNATALRILGQWAAANKQPERAARLVASAERITRRNAGTQLWLFERSLRARNVKQAMRHLDRLLTTEPDLTVAVFPLMVEALKARDFRTELRGYMRPDVGWSIHFLGHAIGATKDLASVVALVEGLGGFPDTESSRLQEQQLMARLVAERRFDEARRILALVPGSSRKVLTEASFTPADRAGQFGIMGWQLLDDPNAGASFSGGGRTRRPTLSIFASSATTQTVASRLLYLQPGRYNFRAAFAELDRADAGYVRFQLNCASPGKSATPWTLDATSKQLASQIQIPADCRVQLLSIIASGGKGQLGIEATINNLTLEQ